MKTSYSYLFLCLTFLTSILTSSFDLNAGSFQRKSSTRTVRPLRIGHNIDMDQLHGANFMSLRQAIQGGDFSAAQRISSDNPETLIYKPDNTQRVQGFIRNKARYHVLNDDTNYVQGLEEQKTVLMEAAAVEDCAILVLIINQLKKYYPDQAAEMIQHQMSVTHLTYEGKIHGNSSAHGETEAQKKLKIKTTQTGPHALYFAASNNHQVNIAILMAHGAQQTKVEIVETTRWTCRERFYKFHKRMFWMGTDSCTRWNASPDMKKIMTGYEGLSLAQATNKAQQANDTQAAEALKAILPLFLGLYERRSIGS